MLRNCIYHLCDDAVPLFHVRKRRFPIQLPGLSKNHESERNQLMKKSNRKKILTVCRACTVSCSTFRTTGCQPASDCRHCLIGIGVTLFSYLLPLFTERLKTEHKLRKRPERTRHLEGTPDLETILWRQIKFQITGKLKEAFPDATWDFVKEPPLSQILDGEPLRIRTRNTGSYNFAEILMDARGSLTLQMMTIESLHKKEPSEGNPDSRPAVNPKSWYSLIGKPLLMELVGDLQARGYEKLFINEQGDVYILNGTEPEVRGKLEHFPPKDYWGELTEIFTEDELTTEETEQALELSWIS
mgnify:CR=1 FL=1